MNVENDVEDRGENMIVGSSGCTKRSRVTVFFTIAVESRRYDHFKPATRQLYAVR
jgi:hypothetical protein